MLHSSLHQGVRGCVRHDSGRADQIPLKAKDQGTVRGTYEWTESGGTIRNTQKDKSLARRHGFIEHKGKKYQ